VLLVPDFLSSVVKSGEELRHPESLGGEKWKQFQHEAQIFSKNQKPTQYEQLEKINYLVKNA
jgi:hypothetical protein